jgi:energy-coupling factor transporter ATP-binding protein EcfA2
MDIRRIDTFGKVAAEDDAILDYFLTTETTKSIEAGTHLLVVGEKGSGKTALVRYYSERSSQGLLCRAIRMTDYPWGVHAQRRDAGAGATDAYTAAWQYLLAVEYAKIVCGACADNEDVCLSRIRRFLHDNYGTADAAPGEILRPDVLKLSGTLEPQFLGVKLGKIEFQRRANDARLGAELHTVAEALFVNAEEAASKYLNDKRIILHIDELDHGLSVLDDSRSSMLTGLVLAARSVFRRFEDRATRFWPIVYLRTDLWGSLRFSDKNKIRQTYTHEIRWTEDELKRLIEVRASKKLARRIKFEELEDGATMRGSQRKWSHIAARTKLRPRDVIQFMNCILSQVKNRVSGSGIISNQDVTAARRDYSTYFKGELDDEVLPHWGDWDVPMASIASLAKLGFSYGEFEASYETRRTDDMLNAKTVLANLFAFSIIGYRQMLSGGGSRWVFRYLEPSAQFDPRATLFKVHLGLKEYYRLREERAASQEIWIDLSTAEDLSVPDPDSEDPSEP